MTRINIRASAIASLKACPMRYRLAHVEQLQAADTDATRQGTSWHALFETYQKAEGDHDAKFDAAITHLNERYAACPNGVDLNKWAIERAVLATSFVGYWWNFQNDPVEYLASEIAFELPLYMPRSGMPLSKEQVVRSGKIDHVVKWQEAICVLERKSTSRSIDSDSDYWQRWRKDSQVSQYALAFRELDLLAEHGDISSSCTRMGNTLVDIWHKPTISPCMLTQKETREFIDTQTYYGQVFRIEYVVVNSKANIEGAAAPTMSVNDVQAEVEQQKKAIAIRETVEMYSARLLADIQERPGYYFQRREIVRTDDELREFRKELFSIYQAMKSYADNDSYFYNESACTATFKCQYLSLCYGEGGAQKWCDGVSVPDGFKRISLPVLDQEV